MNAKSLRSIGSWWQRLTLKRKPTTVAPAPQAPKEPAPAAPDEIDLEGLDNPEAAIRFGYRIILFGFVSFLIWAAVAPIDEGVPATGIVVTESHRKVISHLTGGTVTGVHIHENQSVKVGDILLTLDPTRAQTSLDTALHEYIAASAKLARLTAEQMGANSIAFPDEIREYARQLGREDLLRGQEQLFRVRQQALHSEMAILQENLSASLIIATGARGQLTARRQQVESLRKELESTRPLADEGYTARNRVFEQERQLSELNSVTSDLEARIAREGSSVAELRLRQLQRRQEYLKDVETQSTETRRDVANLSERLKDARAEVERATVRAPVSGQVVGMVAQAPGVVVNPGARLMEIVPSGDKLLLDVQVPVSAANRVKPGLETDIRITSFPDTPTLIIQGKVQSMSDDRHEPPNVMPYYLARIQVTPEGMAKLGGRQLRPGMSADAIIKTGERSFLTYLFAPISRRLFESIKEP